MRTYINARLARVLMVGIFSLSWAFATADCTFGNFSASSNPFAGCSGKITITGTFSIDQDYNVSALPITELIIRGTLVFTANKDLILPTNAILRLEGGGSINTGSPCSNSKRIVIGSTVASCVGASSNFSFDQLNLTGWFSNLGPLPITLANFEAKPGPSSVSLTWRTASELNNDYMAVERSADAIEFQEIGRVKGQGTTQQPQDYRFTDEDPLPGINYYRLRQVDFDGAMEYHNVVAVDFRPEGAAATGLTAFPSPATDNLHLRLAAPFQSEAEYTVTDLQGRVVLRGVFPAQSAQETISIQPLPSGLFVLSLSQDGRTEAVRFVKR
jgi:hypothetical protein